MQISKLTELMCIFHQNLRKIIFKIKAKCLKPQKIKMQIYSNYTENESKKKQNVKINLCNVFF